MRSKILSFQHLPVHSSSFSPSLLDSSSRMNRPRKPRQSLSTLDWRKKSSTRSPQSGKTQDMPVRAQFPATLHHLPRAMSWLREHLKRAGLQKGEILRLELVLEEAFVNSVQ